MKKRKTFKKTTWGSSEVIETRKKYKLRELIIEPSEKIFYQSHHERTEVWTIVEGSGIVNLEGQELDAYPGRCFFIPKESRHSAICTGDNQLKILEIQIGDSIKENDVALHEDQND